jgi:hypothetical protein
MLFNKSRKNKHLFIVDGEGVFGQGTKLPHPQDKILSENTHLKNSTPLACRVELIKPSRFFRAILLYQREIYYLYGPWRFAIKFSQKVIVLVSRNKMIYLVYFEVSSFSH